MDLLNKKPKVSVIVIAYNEEKYISECINSILNQSFKDFELVIVDDCSTDNTSKIINSFKDKRITKIRNKENYNVAKARNIGLKHTKGKFIFFTDADCIADRNWIKNCLKSFTNDNVLGVDGFTYYITKNYKIKTCERPRGTLYYEKFNTCNITYRRSVIEQVDGFNEKRYCEAYEDADLAQRVLKLGKIVHCKGMAVSHQKKEYSYFNIFNKLKWAKYKVQLVKDYQVFPIYRTFFITDKKFIILPLPILDPTHLGYLVFFPFFLFRFYCFRRVRSVKDFIFPFIAYFYFILERLIFWKTAIKERIFII